MNSASDREAISAVMEGAMLAANAGYYFVESGEGMVLRRKCGNALVARIFGEDQRLAVAARGRGPPRG